MAYFHIELIFIHIHTYTHIPIYLQFRLYFIQTYREVVPHPNFLPSTCLIWCYPEDLHKCPFDRSTEETKYIDLCGIHKWVSKGTWQQQGGKQRGLMRHCQGGQILQEGFHVKAGKLGPGRIQNFQCHKQMSSKNSSFSDSIRLAVMGNQLCQSFAPYRAKQLELQKEGLLPRQKRCICGFALAYFWYKQYQFQMSNGEAESDSPYSGRTFFKYELGGTNQIHKKVSELQNSSLLNTFDSFYEQNLSLGTEAQLLAADKWENESDSQSCNEPVSSFEKQFKHFGAKNPIRSFQQGYLRTEKVAYLPVLSQEEQQTSKLESEEAVSKLLTFPNMANEAFYNLNSKSVHSLGKDKYKLSETRKKGLAQISCKVKTIVLKYRKLTYRDVAEHTLQSLSQELKPLSLMYILCQLSTQEKERKNIKRRVYDALNVLVSIGILGRKQRSVCLTPYTHLQGKKLSQRWDEVTKMQQHIAVIKKTCEEKFKRLQKLIQSYLKISALRARNESQLKKSSINAKQILSFPFILLAPKVPSPDKKVKIQQQKCQFTITQKDNKFTFKFGTGTIDLISDMDAACHLNFLENSVTAQQIKQELGIGQETKENNDTQ